MNIFKSLIVSAALGICAATAFAARPLPVVNKDGKQYYEYLVRKGETIYSITHQFGINKDVFLNANPAVAADGLKAETPVFLPVEAVSEKKVVPMPTETVSTTGRTHLVKKGETLYGISKRYNTTVEKLLQENPHAVNGIKTGQILALPISDMDVVEAFESEAEVEPIDATDPEPTEFVEEGALTPSRSYSIAVLLPLMLNESADSHEAKAAEPYTGFLKGMLMAADKFGGEGERVTIHAIDTEGSDARVLSLVNDQRLRDADVVVSPEKASQIAILADAPYSHFSVFNILNVRDTTYLDNERVIQANIPHSVMYAKAIQAMRDEFADYTPVILVSEGGKHEKTAFINSLKASYASAGSPAIREITFSGNLSEEALATLDAENEKYVFIPMSGSLSEFNRIQAALVELKEKSSNPDNVRVFGYPDWIAFRIDRLEKLHKLDATIYSRFYDNPDDTAAGDFASEYARNFGTEVVDMVPKQEILGYDTGCYLIESLRKSGGRITEEPMRYTGIQSSFDFNSPDGRSGISNNALYIINYRPDGSVIKTLR